MLSPAHAALPEYEETIFYSAERYNDNIIYTASKGTNSLNSWISINGSSAYVQASVPADANAYSVATKSDKIDAELQTLSSEFFENGLLDVIITLKAPSGGSGVQAADDFAKAKQEVKSIVEGSLQSDYPVKQSLNKDLRIIYAVSANVLPQTLAELAMSDYVNAIVPDKKVHILLNESVPLINATLVWQLNDAAGKPVTGVNVTIAILDTGVDYTHPDLGGCTQSQFLAGNCSKVKWGYDVINSDNDSIDDHGHGTHVAATAAGNGALLGVAPNATIWAIKVLNSAGSGSWSDVIEGIDRASDPNQDGNFSDHADIISMSLGGSGHPDDAISTAVDVAFGRGIVVVVAAGNSGPVNGTVSSPGNARKALTVGAACKPQQIGVHSYCSIPVASFSSRGPTAIGEVKPDIIAPGVLICAARWGNSFSSSLCVDQRHAAISGTSMATPHIAGVAALLIQAHRNWTPDDVKDNIKSSATNLGLASIIQGSGLVNALAASGLSQYAMIEPSVIRIEAAPNQSYALINTTLTIYNFANQTQNFNLSISLNVSGINFSLPYNISIASSSSSNIVISFSINYSITTTGKSYYGRFVAESGLQRIDSPLIMVLGDRLEVFPSVVDFGVDFPAPGIWNSTVAFTLKNRLNISEEYNLSAYFSTSGVNISLSNNTITLPANGNVSINATLTVNNSRVSNGIFAGNLQINSSLQILSANLKFTKFYILNISTASSPWIVFIHDRNKTYYWNSNPAQNFTVYLSNGGFYDIVTIYWLSTPKFTVRESLNMSGYHTLVLNQSEATNQFWLRIQDEANSQDPYDGSGALSVAHNGSSLGLLITGGISDKILFSNMSDSYSISAMRFAQNGNEVYAGSAFIYGMNGSSGNYTMRAGGTAYNHAKIRYFPNRWARNNYIGLWNAHVGSSLIFASATFSADNVISQPFMQDFFYNPIPDANNYFNAFQISYFDNDYANTFWRRTYLYKSPYYRYSESHSFNSTLNFLGEELPPAPLQLTVGQMPELWYGKVRVSSSYLFFESVFGSGVFSNYFLSDSFDTPYYSQSAFYEYLNVTFNGSVIFNSSINSLYSTSCRCYRLSYAGNGTYKFAVPGRTRQIRNSNYTSKVEVVINTSKSDYDHPLLGYLKVLVDGASEDFVSVYRNTTLMFMVNPSKGNISDVVIAFNNGTSSQTIGFFSTALINWTRYTATLPYSSAYNISISLFVSDDSGNYFNYTFSLPTDYGFDLSSATSFVPNGSSSAMNITISNSGYLSSEIAFVRVLYNAWNGTQLANFTISSVSGNSSATVSIPIAASSTVQSYVIDIDPNWQNNESGRFNNVERLSSREFKASVEHSAQNIQLGNPLNLSAYIYNSGRQKHNVTLRLVYNHTNNQYVLAEQTLSNFSAELPYLLNATVTLNFSALSAANIKLSASYKDDWNILDNILSSISISVANDASRPIISILSPLNNSVQSSNVSLQVKSNELLKNMSMRFNQNLSLLCLNCFNLSIYLAGVNGTNNLTIFAVDLSNNSANLTVNFTVTGGLSSINSFTPSNASFVVGSWNFSINYTESNLSSIMIFLNSSSTAINYTLQNCSAGTAVVCSVLANLSVFSNSAYAEFYFNVSGSSSTASSEHRFIIIDSVGPNTSVSTLDSVIQEQTFAVNWSGSDSGSGLSYFLVQTNNGSAWADWLNTTSTGSLYSASANSTVLFRTIGYDNIGNAEAKTGHDVNTTVFQNFTDTVMPLSSGWNLVGVAKTPYNSSSSHLFKRLSHYTKSVWSYRGSWKSYVRNGGNTVDNLSRGQGIFIYSNASSNFTYGGKTEPRNISITVGWNLVAYSGSTAIVSSALSQIIENVTTVWGFDDSWKYYSSTGPAHLNSLRVMEYGKGYWIYAAANMTWNN